MQVKNAVFVFCSDQYYLHFWEVSVSRDLTVDDFIIMLAYMGMELPNNVARLVACEKAPIKPKQSTFGARMLALLAEFFFRPRREPVRWPKD